LAIEFLLRKYAATVNDTPTANAAADDITRCIPLSGAITGRRAKKSADAKMIRYAAFNPYPSSGLVKGKISASGIQISPAMRKTETSGLTTHEAITPAAAIFPIAKITIGAVKSCAPTDAEILLAKAGGIFPLSRWAQALPKMIIPAQAPYESMNPSVIASEPAIAICTVSMAHSTDKGGGFNPSGLPAGGPYQRKPPRREEPSPHRCLL